MPFNADGFGIAWYEARAALPDDRDADGGDDPDRGVSNGTHSKDVDHASIDGYFQVLAAKKSGILPNGSASTVSDEDPSGGMSTPRVGLQRLPGPQWQDKLKELQIESERPCVFKAITPAWSNANLARLAEKIRSPLVFAHVRASTMPGAPSEDNCHPFAFDRLTVSGFTQIKRKLQSTLSEELYLFPSGYTDSEWSFALFLSKLRDPHASSFTSKELRTAMLETIAHINAISKEVGVKGYHLLNFVVSDGENVVATRYVSSRTASASSLFFSSGTTFEEYQPGGHYRMVRSDKRENMIMLASEPLTFEQKDWMEVRNNHMVVITKIPIMDEYHVAPEQDQQRGMEAPSLLMPRSPIRADFGLVDAR